MQHGRRLRTVVREPLFEQQFHAIEASTQRLDEALAYAEDRTAGDPRSGLQTNVPGIWVAPVRVPSGGEIVRASIFYTFTEDYVHWQEIVLHE